MVVPILWTETSRVKVVARHAQWHELTVPKFCFNVFDGFGLFVRVEFLDYIRLEIVFGLF